MSAVISNCGQYRYRLDRNVSNGGVVILYCGINPSTACSTIDDPTSNRWIGFTKIFGGSRYIAVNPFAYRASNPKELSKVDDPIGSDNAFYIRQAIQDADILIPCWGNVSKVPKHLRGEFNTMLDMMGISGKPVKTFGFTKSGDPKHPLFLSYSTPLVDF